MATAIAVYFFTQVMHVICDQYGQLFENSVNFGALLKVFHNLVHNIHHSHG